MSYETATLLPDSAGKYFFSPDNKPLIQIFRALGVKSLRIGGNTADRKSVPVPGKQDIDSLFAFAKAADVKEGGAVSKAERIRQTAKTLGKPLRAAAARRYGSVHRVAAGLG